MDDDIRIDSNGGGGTGPSLILSLLDAGRFQNNERILAQRIMLVMLVVCSSRGAMYCFGGDNLGEILLIVETGLGPPAQVGRRPSISELSCSTS